jgi:galactokinase/mevalonate kinase-like predicted kinase
MFDLVIVTAANRAQAEGYRAQLRGRKGFIVVPDPGDRRVGSLGATVNVLRILARKHIGSGRVLICHSGGDAKRTPAYAAMGKAFVPMPDGRPMLDHIVDAMDALPSSPGVIVCCGDVVPRLNPKAVRFAAKGVTGVAYPDGPWQAQRHGVYVAKPEKGGAPARVEGFLQKPKVARGRFLVDTGIMHIDWPTAAKMRTLPIAGDIYEEFPRLLLAGFSQFKVSVAPRCGFFHIGSSRELLKLLGHEEPNGATTLVDGVEAPVEMLGGDNIVTNVPAEYGPVRLKKGECLTSLPVGKSGWYHLRYRIDDSFKDDGLWERHRLGEKMPRVDHGRLLALRACASAAKCVRVTAPVRIDLAGGWSDTPPICELEGGTVLAAAVRLDGVRPIEVTVSPRRDRLVKVISRDLGKSRLLKSAREVADHSDPGDWCCLVKSALAVCGFKFGSAGLDIVISADLPKGSGMGTSSILGAATIAAILQAMEVGFVRGAKVDVERVGALTLALEREMRTGGGWEDQFAGMTPGVKMMRSKPGADQKVSVKPVAIPPKAMRELMQRSLLFFTGQKRMARNVLRRVLGFYAENPHGFAKTLVDALKRNAETAAKALGRGDLDAFAACVNRYWRDKRLLDAGSTNEKVDDIVDLISDRASAVTLTGAGGGGFMYIIAKSAADARRIRATLERNPPSPDSRVYAFSVDDVGMRFE